MILPILFAAVVSVADPYVFTDETVEIGGLSDAE